MSKILLLVFLLLFISVAYFLEKKPAEGFASAESPLAIRFCPFGSNEFQTRQGNTDCCSGEVQESKCPSKAICTLSPTHDGIPTCTEYVKRWLDEKARKICPPRLPAYFAQTRTTVNTSGNSPQDIMRRLVLSGQINNYTKCVEHPELWSLSKKIQKAGENLDSIRYNLCAPLFTFAAYNPSDNEDSRRPEYKRGGASSLPGCVHADNRTEDGSNFLFANQSRCYDYGFESEDYAKEDSCVTEKDRALVSCPSYPGLPTNIVTSVTPVQGSSAKVVLFNCQMLNPNNRWDFCVDDVTLRKRARFLGKSWEDLQKDYGIRLCSQYKKVEIDKSEPNPSYSPEAASQNMSATQRQGFCRAYCN